ncbi:hypothetical protein DAPK24_020050 [Pichia kluyveri]|uniref:DH domain-containing protein n=1 Tax=Pichia kluyveri TaxID=36015 RepID=A0AAV5R1X6_PICKL|nr:hypothetical protein DAPK24_020050 [Pichia kluyveri]
MSFRYHDTSSSVYPEDIYSAKNNQNSYNYLKKLRTPPRKTQADETSLFDSSELHDDVYKPYITPPTPFEKSTQDHFGSDNGPSNPYAQSLWYTFRGNDGNEIDKYKKLATETQETKPVLVDKNGDRKELLPSLMLKTKWLENDENKIKEKVDIQRNSNNQYNRIQSSYAILDNSTPISDFFQSYAQGSDDEYIDSVDENILRPLNNPPPYDFISIETNLVKKLKLIFELSLKFKSFVEENKILLNSKVTLYLFSNIKTLLLIHFNFLDIILDIRNNKYDIEETIFDHLQRLHHVYPSYLESSKLRNRFTRLIIQNPKFKTFVINRNSRISEENPNEKKTLDIDEYFVNEFEGEEGFYKLITSLSKDFRKLLLYLKDYIGKSSPRIDVLIDKLDEYFEQNEVTEPNKAYNSKNLENSCNDNIAIDESNEPLYLEIPQHWRTEHKLSWKEISGLNIERQMAYYLRSEMKKDYENYAKVSKLIKNQTDQISKLSIYNNYIAKKFIQIDTELPRGGLVGNKYIENLLDVDEQNKKVYKLVESLVEFSNDVSFQITDELIKKFCKLAKMIFTGTDLLSNTADLLFDINKFRLLFKERALLLIIKFETFFMEYIEIVGPSDGIVNYDSNDIVASFKRRVNETTSDNEHSMKINEEVNRVWAYDRLVKRFFPQNRHNAI